MTRIPATIACVGGLAVLSLLLAAAWTWHRAGLPREVASAAIGPGTDARACWPRGLLDGVVATEIGDRSGVTDAPVPDTESPEVDPRDALPLLPVPQPDIAWEPPLADPLDQGDSRLEVDEQCRPIQVIKTSRSEDREARAAADAAGNGEPTLAPPEPLELNAGRQVIRVVVEAEQAAGTKDAHQR